MHLFICFTIITGMYDIIKVGAISNNFLLPPPKKDLEKLI